MAISTTAQPIDVTNSAWNFPKGFDFRQFTLPSTPITCFRSNDNRFWRNGPTSRSMLQMIDRHLGNIPVQLMQQFHSNIVKKVTHRAWHIRADAMITHRQHLGLATYTADCVPIILTDRAQQRIAIVHAGWRGLYQNIIAHTYHAMRDAEATAFDAWIGPSICQSCYQVSLAFFKQFVAQHPHSRSYFTFLDDHAYFDCLGFASKQLHDCGIRHVHIDSRCTFEHPSIPSHRHQGDQSSARLLSVVWLT
jgi:YfiH family protein